MNDQTFTAAVNAVSAGFNIVSSSLKLLSPGSGAVDVQFEGGSIKLVDALSAAGRPFSSKQTYARADGTILGENDVLRDGDVVSAIAVTDNG